MPAHLFLYGALRHLPLLETILGRKLDPGDLRPGLLPEHAVYTVGKGPGPMIRSAPGSDAHGQVLSDVSDADLARVSYYSAIYGFVPREKTLQAGERAQVFFPDPEIGLAATDLWVFEHWRAAWGDFDTAAAAEAMSYYDRLTPEEVGRLLPRIRARAQSTLNARQGRHGAGTLDGEVEMIRRDRVHLGFFLLDKMVLRHSSFSGGLGPVVEREVFVTSDAAIVLPYDPLRDRVLLVEQVRMGPIGRGDPVLWQLEPVAGLIDPGETPAETARREAMEEAGIEIGRLEPVAEAYASPGATSDFHYIFVGITDLPETLGAHGGRMDEGEDIRVHLMQFADLMEMAEAQRTANTPLTLAAYWLAHHRARLRQTG